MSISKAFANLFYRNITKAFDQKVRQKKAQDKHAEKQRQNDNIHLQKVRLLQDEIELAEDYLRNEVRVLELFETKRKHIQTWFFQNYWLKTIDQRRSSANYSEIKMTFAQKRELLDKLQLKPEDYVPHGILNDLTESTTLEFIIENTAVIAELRIQQDKEGYSLYIANHYTDYRRIDTTICFGLVIKEDAKQPF